MRPGGGHAIALLNGWVAVLFFVASLLVMHTGDKWGDFPGAFWNRFDSYTSSESVT